MSEGHSSVGRGSVWWIDWTDARGSRRVALTRRLSIGRSPTQDVVLDDIYVSREHCTIALEDGTVRVDASRSVNRIVVNGRMVETAVFASAGSFAIGETTIHIRPAGAAEDTTLPLSSARASLVFRRSTRELLAFDGTLISRFSTQEAAAFGVIASSYPDAAPTQAISTAVWGEPDYESYLIHRLMQRVRLRMGDSATLVGSVRGAGYRLLGPVDMR
jgi:hypothetical protein